MGSCDNNITETQKETDKTQEEVLASGKINFSPLPFENYGFAFNPPRKNVDKNNGPATQGADIPYGCVISSLNKPGSDHRYSYRAYELAFPEDIINKAVGESRTYVFVIDDEQAGDWAASFLDKNHVSARGSVSHSCGQRSRILGERQSA